MRRKAANSVLANWNSEKIDKYLKTNYIDENKSVKAEEKAELTLFEVERIMRVLQKQPKDRTLDDIQHIFPFAQNLKLLTDNAKDVDMSEESVRIICEQMMFKFHPEGEVVFNYGDKGEFFYIILKGRVSIQVPSDIRKSIRRPKHKQSQIYTAE